MLQKIGPLDQSPLAKKMPSEMEVALHYKLLTLSTLLTWFTLLA